MKKSLRFWISKVFARDLNLEKNSFLYLFFSFLAITFVIEYFILKFIVCMRVGLEREIFFNLTLFGISIFFLASGFFVDFIKNKTKLFYLSLVVCILGLFLITFVNFSINLIGLVIVLITIPVLITVWCSTLVHSTNILNRGRIVAIIIVICYLLGLIGLFFVYFESLFIFLIVIEAFLLIIIIWISRFYNYTETEKRLTSEKKYFNIIFEKHFSRYSIGFAFLSGLLGGLLNDTLGYFTPFEGYKIEIITFSITSIFYVLGAGWFFDTVGRKNTLVIGILIVSFFYITHGSFYETAPELSVFGISKEIHISFHYAFALLPLILTIIVISGDFSTERGNLKYRGRINGLFIALMFFGLGVGYLLYKMIEILYNTFPDMRSWVPDAPNLLNSFVLVITLVWIMAGKDILVSKERDWAKTLKSIFVFSNSGVCIYNHSFIRKYQPKEDEEECAFDEDLVSGALSGVITIISEITRSKKYIKKIDKEGNHLFFAFGKYHIAALIATTDLPVLFKKLDNFSQEFEHTFSKDLKKFQGNIQKFASTKYIIRKYFSQKYSEFF
ncbi:MAG: hypothetical protein ACFE9Q_07010 [Candidatus Hodarchaeota archaeon]